MTEIIKLNGSKLFKLHYIYDEVFYTFQAYLVGANFGTSDAEVNVTAVLPNDFTADEGEIAIVTSNVDEYLPRSKIPLSDKIILGPKQGIIVKIK